MAADWYYRAGNREVGPLSFRDLAAIARQGRIGAETEVRRGQDGAWIGAGRVAGLIHGADAGRGRSTPPPLPSGADALFDAIDRFGRTPSAGKANGAGNSSLAVGLYCFGGIAAAVALLTVLILAAGTGDHARAPVAENAGAAKSRAAPIGSGGATIVAPAAIAARRAKPAPPANWMERIDEKSHESVVVVVNTEGDSLGTGFVIAADGDHKLLLTNKHVLRIGDNPKTDPLARNCLIKLVSGTIIPARLAGEAREPAVDLAMIEVDSRDLQPLGVIKEFANIHVGENVVSVGNPGIPGTAVILEGTVTPGIVSGKREELLIQTTAPINHGNSGGPLVNETGQVLGVNTMSAKDMQATNFAFRADWVLDKGHWSYYQDVARLMAAIPRQ